MRTGIFTIPRLRADRINTFQDPMVWGFPGPTAWVGLMEALNLRFGEGSPLTLTGVAALPHSFSPNNYRARFRQFPVLPRAPLVRDGRRGKAKVGGIQNAQGCSASAEVTFVFRAEFEGDTDTVCDDLADALMSMRFAGGSLFPSDRPRRPWALGLSGDPEADEEAVTSIFSRWALTSVLKLRPGLIDAHWKQLREGDPSVGRIHAFLDLFAVKDKRRPHSGWLVPVSTGYQAVSPQYPAGAIEGTRDDSIPFRFVEGIWSVGEWVSPFRLTPADPVLFRPSFDPETATYRCIPENLLTL